MRVGRTGGGGPGLVGRRCGVDKEGQGPGGREAVGRVADAKGRSARRKDAPEAKNRIAFAEGIILNSRIS